MSGCTSGRLIGSDHQTRNYHEVCLSFLSSHGFEAD